MWRSAGACLVLVAVVGFGMFMCGCGGGKGTPEAAFETFKKTALNDDFGGMWDCLSSNAHTQMEGMFKMVEGMGGANAEDFKKEWGMTLEEFSKLSTKEKFVKMCSQQKKEVAERDKEREEIKSSTITECKIEGDKATLKIKSGSKDEEMRMVKEGNEWKLEGQPR